MVDTSIGIFCLVGLVILFLFLLLRNSFELFFHSNYTILPSHMQCVSDPISPACNVVTIFTLVTLRVNNNNSYLALCIFPSWLLKLSIFSCAFCHLCIFFVELFLHICCSCLNWFVCSCRSELFIYSKF